jgi:hypothetical protein
MFKVNNLKEKIKRLENALETTRKDLYDYKNDPKRKDDLHISIDRNGQIWLIDAITKRNLLNISFENLKNILKSLTFANIKYYYFKDSRQSIKIAKKIKTTLAN